jgi:transposase
LKSVQVQEVIRKAKFKQGKSNRQIALELGISRNTVKKVISRKPVELPVYQRTQAIQYPVMGPYLAIIEGWLQEEDAFPRKQRYTGKRIYDRLVSEYQFRGSYRRVQEVVAAFRKKPKEAFLPLAFQPGEMAQVEALLHKSDKGQSSPIYTFVRRF